jgi:predicted signal transduction protein with EAL and GGDEF domain
MIVEDLALNTVDAMVRVRDIAEFLRQQFMQPFELKGSAYNCSVSIGVAMFSDAEGNVENLLKGADLALAAAKVNGRNQVQFFNRAMQIEVTRRARIENAIRHALKGNAFMLHVQPQVDREGQIVSMEGLLRMTDPELGLVSPAEFIPVAETSGLIVPLGEWVVDSA